MQPLKILALALGLGPVLAFLLTVVLTDGAPLQPPPGEEREPAAVALERPQSSVARQTGVAAAGFRHAAADRPAAGR